MILEQKCIQYGFGSMYLQCDNTGVSDKNRNTVILSTMHF